MKKPFGKLLGSGTYGKVYKVYGKPLAIKHIKTSSTGLQELGELNYLKMFKHPYLLHCVDFGIYNGLAITLPLASGDMFDIMKKCGGTIKTVVIVEWFFQLISAVHFLHKNNFYHCDIKIENVLFINDHIVLADLGLVGKRGVTPIACQTIVSPQRFKIKKNAGLVNQAIFNLPSDEFQDDIWALGMTLYDMIPGTTRIGADKISIDGFISNPEKALLYNKVPPIYMPLLLILLNPLPHKRSLNLISLLSLDIFKGRKNLVDGTLVHVPTKTPVVFGKPDIKQKFMDVFKITSAICSHVDKVFAIQIYDLLYRTYEFVKPTSKNARDYVDTLFILVCKVNGLDFLGLVVTPAIKELEKRIVIHTDGHLTRTNISDLIAPARYKTFISWLSSHPDEYENHSTDTLAKIINSI